MKTNLNIINALINLKFNKLLFLPLGESIAGFYVFS